MKDFQTGVKYLVKDTSPIGQLYYIEIRATYDPDIFFIKDFLYKTIYMMTSDEIMTEFTFVK